MNFYKKKLQEKEEYLHGTPGDKTQDLKKTKLFKMKHPPKNAKLGIFK